jgi:NAD-dependent dihydropyrimidine dehydrogenase PreA subunit
MEKTIEKTTDIQTAASCCCSSCGCAAQVVIVGNPFNTLTYDSSLCVGCEMCSIVCPHGVFEMGLRLAELVRPEACMECGACQRNCPSGAIRVDSGVGCAAAMIAAALTGGEPACGCDTDSGNCCS